MFCVQLTNTCNTGCKRIIGLQNGLETKKICILNIMVLNGRFLCVIGTRFYRYIVMLRCKHFSDCLIQNVHKSGIV